MNLNLGLSMLTLILAEAALETIPTELWSNPAVRSHAKKQGKPPKQLLLDRSIHHSAMRHLYNNFKRGRPDITHFALLEALGSPLNIEGVLQVYVHTNNDFVITVNPEVRLPRNYRRFVGLIEQLFQERQVPLNEEPLLILEQKTLHQLLVEIQTDYTLAFSRQGQPKTIHTAVSVLRSKQHPTIIIGGFAHGHFSKTTTQLLDETVCVDPEMLEVWTIISRVIYEYEKSLSIPKKRLESLQIE